MKSEKSKAEGHSTTHNNKLMLNVTFVIGLFALFLSRFISLLPFGAMVLFTMENPHKITISKIHWMRGHYTSKL